MKEIVFIVVLQIFLAAPFSGDDEQLHYCTCCVCVCVYVSILHLEGGLSRV
jgi:hypothetical protein